MEYGYVIDYEKYNKITGLYDVTVIIDKNKKIISCYRILNPTILKYTEEPGYFLISLNSKYIYINDKTDINTLLKNIIFSKNNLNYSNEDILEINIDPIKKYTLISSIDIPAESYINLAFEDNDVDRNYQIINNNIYSKYDCLVVNAMMINNNFTNIEPKKGGIFESLSHYFTGKKSEITTEKSDSGCTVNINSEIETINQYNNFYVYGLTSLNLLFLIIVIIMVFSLVNDSEKINKKVKRSSIDI